ncbi:MAG: inositol monophosphatase [Dehalococcoidia bacterium]|nr:inositol monophosphatase [Dehalococcoidia bacterium]
MSADPQGRDLLALAVEIAAEAAVIVAKYAAERTYAIETKSSPTDLVTEADRESEALIVRAILGARPHDGLLGEEGASREGASGIRWVIDPIDGTTNFVYGIPAYSVSIGVERDGQVIAGVVHDVALKEAYTASLGGGAHLNGLPIHVSARADLSASLWGIGFAYDPHRRGEQAKFYDRVMTHIRDVRRMGSAALDLCRVASGQLDGYWEFQLNAWDIAAGGIIAREAGAVTRGFHGYTFEEGYVLASNPALNAPMLAVLDAYR